MSLKRKEQGSRERVQELEEQLHAAQRDAGAASEAAQRAQQESSAAAEALRGEAISAREQAADLSDRVEALESQLQEKVCAPIYRIVGCFLHGPALPKLAIELSQAHFQTSGEFCSIVSSRQAIVQILLLLTSNTAPAAGQTLGCPKPL